MNKVYIIHATAAAVSCLLLTTPMLPKRISNVHPGAHLNLTQAEHPFKLLAGIVGII